MQHNNPQKEQGMIFFFCVLLLLGSDLLLLQGVTGRAVLFIISKSFLCVYRLETAKLSTGFKIVLCWMFSYAPMFLENHYQAHLVISWKLLNIINIFVFSFHF